MSSPAGHSLVVCVLTLLSWEKGYKQTRLNNASGYPGLEFAGAANLLAAPASTPSSGSVGKELNPLTTTRYKSAAQLWEFLTNLFLYRLHCKFYTGEPCVFQLSVAKKLNQFIVYTAQFRSVYRIYQKVVFSAKKAVHCSGALLKKRKRFFVIISNRLQRYQNF